MQRDLATIETGTLPHLILVDGNPLYDVTARAHVGAVVKSGKAFKSPAVK